MSQNILSIALVAILFCTGFVSEQCELSAQQTQAQELNILKGTILTSDDEPAANAIVLGAKRQNQTIRLTNIVPQNMPATPIAAPMKTIPADENGRRVNLGSAIDGGRFFAADDQGQFEYSEWVTSFFVQSEDGTEAAFVPPGSRFPIRLKKCASLKINNSILAKEKSKFGRGSILIVWRNCLAAAYPLRYPPNSNADLPPRDWKLYPYFSIATQLDDVDLNAEFEFELLLPPGEVSISVLTDNQRSHLENFSQTTLKMRRHFPSTCGIVSLSSAVTTKVPLRLGTCINGKIVEKENSASPLPNWSPGNRGYVMRFHGGDPVNVVYPKSKKKNITLEDNYREFQNSAPQIVEKLTSLPDGPKFRIQTSAGVVAAMFDNYGNFTSVPLADGSYFGDLNSFERTKVRQTEFANKDVRIPKGYKVIHVKAELDRNEDGIESGNHVDVVHLSDNGDTKETGTTILNYVKVFNVSSDRTIVGLLVTAKQSEKIVAARKTGTLHLLLRKEKLAIAFQPSSTTGGGPKKCILVSPLIQQNVVKFSGGFLTMRQVDGNSIFKTKPNEPFFHAGEFVAVAVDEASKVKPKKANLKNRSKVDPELKAFSIGELGDEFDAKMKRRIKELDELELSIKAARKKLSVRQLQRDAIIKRRFEDLAGDQATKQFFAETKIGILVNACNIYHLQVGQFPTSLEDLVSKPDGLGLAQWGGPFLEKPISNDSWNRPFQLKVNAANDQLTIISAGPDGQTGTDDDIARQLKR